MDTEITILIGQLLTEEEIHGREGLETRYESKEFINQSNFRFYVKQMLEARDLCCHFEKGQDQQKFLV